MGILDTIRDALIPRRPRSADHDAERADVERRVAEFARQREDADATIAGWNRQTEAALRGYAPRRSDLAETLRRARVEREGQP